jgi:PncC family amidohydrolase
LTWSTSNLPVELSNTVKSAQARLAATGATVAVAEATCGGLVTYLLSETSEEATWFRVGLVVYSNDAKRDLAGIPTDVLSAHGAVSQESALALARGVRERWGATWGIAETGIAGPVGQRRSRKPLGQVILAIVGPADQPGTAPVEVVEEYVTGLDDRIANKRAFAAALLRLFDATLAGALPESV